KRFLKSMIEFAVAEKLEEDKVSRKLSGKDSKQVSNFTEYREGKSDSNAEDDEISLDDITKPKSLDNEDLLLDPTMNGDRKRKVVDDSDIDATLETHERIMAQRDQKRTTLAKVNIVE